MALQWAVLLTLHILIKNVHPAAQAKCAEDDCLQCDENKLCQRCVHFIEPDNRKCVTKCAAGYDVILTGEITGAVCHASSPTAPLSSGYLAVVIVVSVGLAISVGVGIAFYCFCLRSKSSKPSKESFVVHEEDKPTVEYGNAIYDNSSICSKSEYKELVGELQPYSDVLLKMKSEAESKLTLAEADTEKYKAIQNVILHLSRVLTLLDRDKSSNIPPDGSSLMIWAKSSLHRYLAHNTDSSPKVKHGSVRPLVLTTFKTELKATNIDSIESTDPDLSDEEPAMFQSPFKEVTNRFHSTEYTDPIQV